MPGIRESNLVLLVRRVGTVALASACLSCSSGTDVLGGDHVSSVFLRGSIGVAEEGVEGWEVDARWLLNSPGAFYGPLILDTTDVTGSFGGGFWVGNGPSTAHILVTATSPTGLVREADLGEVAMSLGFPDTVEVVFP